MGNFQCKYWLWASYLEAIKVFSFAVNSHFKSEAYCDGIKGIVANIWKVTDSKINDQKLIWEK